jgi:hypothetical protein
MRDGQDQEPSEHHIRLVQLVLGVTVGYLALPCLAGLFGARPAKVAALTGLSEPVVFTLLFVVPGALAVLLSFGGVVLARSAGSRLLFVGTAVLGVVIPVVVNFLLTLAGW